MSIDDEAHAEEHSLEVQLPFLQILLDSFSLVPFSVGDASGEDVASVLEALWGGDETLVIVSSDLSHYLGYAEARSEEHTSELQSRRNLVCRLLLETKNINNKNN